MALPGLFGGGGGDRLGLLLGQGEDLVDHRAEVAEGGLFHLRWALAQVGQLGLGLLQLPGKFLDLDEAALALLHEGVQLAFDLGDEFVHLAFVIAAHRTHKGWPRNEILTRCGVLFALGHAPSSK